MNAATALHVPGTEASTLSSPSGIARKLAGLALEASFRARSDGAMNQRPAKSTSSPGPGVIQPVPVVCSMDRRWHLATCFCVSGAARTSSGCLSRYALAAGENLARQATIREISNGDSRLNATRVGTLLCVSLESRLPGWASNAPARERAQRCVVISDPLLPVHEPAGHRSCSLVTESWSRKPGRRRWRAEGDSMLPIWIRLKRTLCSFTSIGFIDLDRARRRCAAASGARRSCEIQTSPSA
jgi:hypothetical protein